MIATSLTFGFAVVSLANLDPTQPPSGNFDLRHWKLTLPDVDATEISTYELTAGFTNNFFYTGPDGAMTLWCPVTGGITEGTPYPRSELREMLNPDNEYQNWTGYGTNRLMAQCKVTQVPSSETVVIGQIHSFTGNAYPLVKLQLNHGNLEALVRETPTALVDTTLPLGSAALGNLVTYQLNLTEGLLSISANASNQSLNVFQTGPGWKNQKFFFKAGAYCQDNSGSETEGSTVAFYQLEVLHISPPASLTAITLTECAINAGLPTFTVLVPGPGNYFVQSSTDLVHWNYVLVTNTVVDQFRFTDTAKPGARKFYRGGTFATPTIMDSGIKSPGQFGFTLFGPGAGNYFIQSSSDLVHWNYLLFTNSVSGRIDFVEPMTPGAHFYRGGSF